MRFIFAIVVVCLAVQVAQSKVFTRCALARALLNNGFKRSDLDNWVCLVESESSRNTEAVGGPNSDGSYDYGLFQINNRYWCKVGYKGGDCNMDCKDFLKDNIKDASKCAKLIYSRSGFQAWYGWIKKCKNQTLPDIKKECNF